LSSSFDKQVKKVDQLIIHGELNEAYRMINESLKNKKISIVEELHFLTFKSELEFYFGNFDESIRLADVILKKSKGLNNLLTSVDALTWKAISCFFNGKTGDCLETIEKGRTTISSAKNPPEKAFAKRKAQFQTWQAFVIIHLGDFAKGLELAKEASSFAEKSEYKNAICLNLLIIAECYAKLGENERCKEYGEKALTIANELGNKFLVAFCFGFLTRAHNWNRESEIVEELFKKALFLAEEVGAKMLFAFKNDLGGFYRDLFRFDEALKYLHEALEVTPYMRYLSNDHIGLIYFWKYDLEQAQEYYLESLKYCEEMNDRYILPRTLSNLIQISIELNDITRAKKYLKRLKELSEEPGFERIGYNYRYASILVLKASGDISDLGKAAELTKAYLADENLPSWRRLDALYTFLEIRLKELQLSPNEETLREVQKRIHHLEFEAEERQLEWFLANVYRLQSQLALVELDVKKALEFLEKAQTIADKIDVELLRNETKKDREKINQQLSMLQKFQKQNAPISETVKLVSLENTAQSIKHETVLEERDQETGEIIEYRKLFVLKF